jgi:hypothetical protein
MPVGAFYGQDNLVFTLATGRHQINVLGIGYDFAVALAQAFDVWSLK